MPQRSGAGLESLTRREAIGRVATGLGLMSVLHAGEGASEAGTAAAPQSAAPGGAPTMPSWNTELRQLAPNVYAYTQAGGPGVPNSAISNGGCIVGPDDWMAVDAFAAPPHTKAFLAAANKAIGKPCRRLVNTHHHADHTTGNCFFLPAEIIASSFCRDAVIKGGISNLSGRPESWKVGAEELKLAPPVTTIDRGEMTYRYGDLEVRLIHTGPAHTWGDVLVYLPEHKILFGGDIAFFYVAPASQSGWISKWIETIDQINQMDVDVIVPGHGPIGTKKELGLMREYLDMVRREARKGFDAGITAGKAAASIDMGKFEPWGDPAANRVPTHFVRLYAEFKGSISPNTDSAASRAASEEYNALKGVRSR
jgi:cyclase